MKMIYTLRLVFFLIVTMSLNAQIWQPVNSPKPYIYKIAFDRNDANFFMLASDSIPIDISEKEIQFYPINYYGMEYTKDGGNTYSEKKLINLIVTDIVQSHTDDDTWYASYVNKTRGGFAISTDRGETWDWETTECDGFFRPLKLNCTENSEKYYASCVNTGEGIKVSTDKFQTCESLPGLTISARDLELSKAQAGLMFAASDDTYDGRVWRSHDNGETWQKDSMGLRGLRVHTVMPSGEFPAHLVCGADTVATDGVSFGKGIFLSLDTGVTWQHVNAFDEWVYEIAVHPANPDFMAAACGKDGVRISGNGGYWWEQRNSGLPPDADVRTVSIPDLETNDDGVIVYAGTFGQGIFKSSRITTDIEKFPGRKPLDLIHTIHPQPTDDYLNINFSLCRGDNLVLRVYDYLGMELISYSIGYYMEGEYSHVVEVMQLNPGMYMLEISGQYHKESRKFTVNR